MELTIENPPEVAPASGSAPVTASPLAPAAGSSDTAITPATTATLTAEAPVAEQNLPGGTPESPSAMPPAEDLPPLPPSLILPVPAPVPAPAPAPAPASVPEAAEGVKGDERTAAAPSDAGLGAPPPIPLESPPAATPVPVPAPAPEMAPAPVPVPVPVPAPAPPPAPAAGSAQASGPEPATALAAASTPEAAAGARTGTTPAPKVDSAVVQASASTSTSTSTDPASLQAEDAPVKLKEAGRAAARVGDEVITLNELTVAVKERIAALPMPKDYQPNRQEIMMITSQVLDQLIERTTILQEAKRELKKPEQIQLFRKLADQCWREEELPPLLRKYQVENEYKLKDKLAEEGKSIDAMRETFRQEFLAKGFIEQKLGPKLRVTVSEMREYYNAHLDDYNRPEQWTWHEVLVEVDKYPSRAQARSKAEAILARLRRGEDFATVARAESEGPNRKQGGLWETAPDSYAVPAVNEALKALPIGQVSTIIEGPSSFHLVRVDTRRPAGPASFPEVQDKIRRIVHNQKAKRESDALFDKLLSQTVVTTIFDKTDYAPASIRKAFRASPATSAPAPAPAPSSPASP
jgi:hypothetical protein